MEKSGEREKNIAPVSSCGTKLSLGTWKGKGGKSSRVEKKKEFSKSSSMRGFSILKKRKARVQDLSGRGLALSNEVRKRLIICSGKEML